MPLDDYIAQLTFNGFFSYEIRRNKADHRTLDGLRIVTMHRLKDFEFQHVFIVAVNKRIEADVRLELSYLWPLGKPFHVFQVSQRG